MKPIYVILCIVIASGLKEYSDAYLRNHRTADAIVAGIGAAAVAIIAGMAPSPAQANAIASLRAELLAALQQIQAQVQAPVTAPNVGQVAQSSGSAPITQPTSVAIGPPGGVITDNAPPVNQNV